MYFYDNSFNLHFFYTSIKYILLYPDFENEIDSISSYLLFFSPDLIATVLSKDNGMGIFLLSPKYICLILV